MANLLSPEYFLHPAAPGQATAFVEDQIPADERDPLQPGGSRKNNLNTMLHVAQMKAQEGALILPPVPTRILDVPRGYTLWSDDRSKNPYKFLPYWEKWERSTVPDFDDISPASISRYRKNKKVFDFVPTEIMRSGTLQCSPCRPNDLTYPIHKIFRRENFLNCDPEAYAALEPAFRLASIWLTHPACHHFWATLIFGERRCDPEALQKNEWRYRVHRFNMKPTERNFGLYEHYFSMLGDNITFEYTKELFNPDCGSSHRAFGMTNFEPDMTRAMNEDLNPWEHRTIVVLCRDFYTQACKFAQLTHIDEAARMRFNFFTAINLCHELAHSMEAKVKAVHMMLLRTDVANAAGVKHWYNMQIMDRGLGFLTEPKFEDQTFDEMGTAWETSFLGGITQPINSRVDCVDGIYVKVGDLVRGDIGMRKLYSVPMGYMEEMQQQSFWDRLLGKRVPRGYFKIPYVGAVCFGDGMCTTVRMKDFLLQREAEWAQESRAGQLQQSAMTTTSTDQGAGAPSQTLLSDYKKASNTGTSSGGTTSTASSLDPLTKDPGRLTLADKWILTEEYYGLYYAYTSLKFNSERYRQQLRLPSVFAPWMEESWQQPQLDLLKTLRATREPHKRYPEPNPDDKMIGQIAAKWQWFEELAVYNGHTRLELYRMREAGIPHFPNAPSYDPNNEVSWGTQEVNHLKRLRTRSQISTLKWHWLEEYSKLGFGFTRNKFLRQKQLGYITLDSSRNPDSPNSWTDQEILELVRMRYELTDARIDQKWTWFKFFWALKGKTEAQLMIDLTSGDLHRLYFNVRPELDPHNYMSWTAPQVEELKEAMDTEYKRTGRVPVGADLIHRDLVPQDVLNKVLNMVAVPASSAQRDPLNPMDLLREEIPPAAMEMYNKEIKLMELAARSPNIRPFDPESPRLAPLARGSLYPSPPLFRALPNPVTRGFQLPPWH